MQQQYDEIAALRKEAEQLIGLIAFENEKEVRLKSELEVQTSTLSEKLVLKTSYNAQAEIHQNELVVYTNTIQDMK